MEKPREKDLVINQLEQLTGRKLPKDLLYIRIGLPHRFDLQFTPAEDNDILNSLGLQDDELAIVDGYTIYLLASDKSRESYICKSAVKMYRKLSEVYGLDVSVIGSWAM